LSTERLESLFEAGIPLKACTRPVDNGSIDSRFHTRAFTGALAVVVCVAAGTLTGTAAIAAKAFARGRALPSGITFPPPLWTAPIGSNVEYSNPTFATIDGVRAIVAGSLAGWVYVMNALTGKELPGWPEPADIVGRTPTDIDSSPAVAYLDGPKEPPTIIVGAGSKTNQNQNGGLIAWYATGKVRFVFHTKDKHQNGVDSPYDADVFASPAIGDI